MRIYRDLKEAAREIERDLFEMGIESRSTTHQNHDVSNSDDFDSKELMGYTYSVPLNLDLNSSLSALEYMGKNPSKSIEYCFKEVADRISGQNNPGESYLIFPEVWNEFLNQEGQFDYTYYDRFHSNDQWNRTIKELTRNLESRRAILQIYSLREDTLARAERLRIPCSMHYQFMIRKVEGNFKLNVIYVMRSCDFYEHWVHDMIMAAEIGKIMALNIQRLTNEVITSGSLIHQTGSLHILKKDYSKRDIF